MTKAYDDLQEFRQHILELAIMMPVIPACRSNLRSWHPPTMTGHLYRERHLVEVLHQPDQALSAGSGSRFEKRGPPDTWAILHGHRRSHLVSGEISTEPSYTVRNLTPCLARVDLMLELTASIVGPR